MPNSGIKHLIIAPYKACQNGQAELFVQIFGDFLKKNSALSINRKISTFLFSYRNTPSVTTGKTSAELFLGRIVRIQLSLVKPDPSNYSNAVDIFDNLSGGPFR